jgi:molybdenum cofactor cytidylyltransferase
MTGLVILAAGSSSRLGFPKQTLLYKGKTLLELAIEAGLKSKCKPVMVVLGANAEAIEPGIKHNDVTLIHNPHWAEGMTSAIRVAISHLEKHIEIDSVIIMLCDQPFVNRALIDSLLYKQQQTGSQIVACAYKNTIGVPVLFKRSLFTELLSLQGQDGAKKLLQAHPDDIATVPFEKGGIDIDTLADYEDLIFLNKKSP